MTGSPLWPGPSASNQPAPPLKPVSRSIAQVGIALTLAFAILAGGAGFWQVFRSEELSTAPDNPAVIAAARNVIRGEIIDRDGTVLAMNRVDANGEPFRLYADRVVAPVVGYASRRYGTAGLERAYSAALTGLNDPDPIRNLLKKFQADPYDPQTLSLSLSLPLQRAAVRGLGDDHGAVVMLDPRTGEVLALASTPIYDASAIANPRHAGRRVRRGSRRPGPAAADPADAGSLRARIGVQDRDRRRRASGPARSSPTRRSRTRPRQSGTASSSTGSGSTSTLASRLGRTTSSARPRCRRTSGSRSPASRPAATTSSEYAGRMGFGGRLPFDLPTAASQVTVRRRHGAGRVRGRHGAGERRLRPGADVRDPAPDGARRGDRRQRRRADAAAARDRDDRQAGHADDRARRRSSG